MKSFARPVLIVAVGLIALIAGSWYVQAQRARQRSVLSGFFETQPTDMASRVGGRISRVLVNEGDAVRKGQPLLELNVKPDREATAAKLAAAQQAQELLLEVENGPRPEDIKQAQARLQAADAQYRKVVAGPRPQEIAEARAAAAVARARLAQAQRGPTAEERAEAKSRLDAAAAQESLARSDAERFNALYAQEAISRQQYDQAAAALKEARANRRQMEEAWRRAEKGTPKEELQQAEAAYQQARAALELVLAGSRPEDIQAAAAERRAAQEALNELLAGSRTEQVAQARAAAAAAQAAAKSAQANLADWVLRAPMNAVVESVPVAVGDLVAPGAMLLRLDDPRDIWLRVYVPESNLARVTVGGTASLRVDGIGELLAARVESISTRGEFTPANLQTPDERGKQVFGVRLRLKRPDPRVKAGMYATVVQIGDWRP